MRYRYLLLVPILFAACAPGAHTRWRANRDPLSRVRVLPSSRVLDELPHRVLDTLEVKVDVNAMRGPADVRLRVAAAEMGANAIVFDTVGTGKQARLRGVAIRLEQPFADARAMCHEGGSGVEAGARIEACEREVAKDTLNVAAWRALAERRRAAWDYHGERAALERVVALAPNDATAWYALGRATKGRGSGDEKLAAWRRAATIDTTYAAPRLAVGITLADDAKRAADALPWLDEALRLGARGEALYWKGRALLQLQRWQEAHEAFVTAADSGGMKPTWTYAGAAYALSRAGRHAEAVAQWDRVLTLNGDWFHFAWRESDMIADEKAAWERSRKAIGR